MLIKRDFLDTLKGHARLEAVLLWGPRQVGKTTLLDQLMLPTKFFLDDLGIRQRAQNDPALLLDSAPLPCLIDEAQYAPNLFPEIKLRIDRLRREGLRSGLPTALQPLFYLTGSNRLLLDRKVKESLAGRSHNYTLHGLSVRELNSAIPELTIKTILLRGGLPELYTRSNLSPIDYLNDYVLTFIEKDIALSAGVLKLDEFHTVLRLLAARTGQFLNLNEIAGASGVEQKTVQAWIGLLEKSGIVQRVEPYFSNLSKRLTKMRKFYFYDTGLCARLQAQVSEDTLWNSAQAGSLFETLVFSELVKTRDNFLRSWLVHAWRTKDQNEVDFILQHEIGTWFIEAKMAIHGARPFSLDREALKVFPPPHHKLVVTTGGAITRLDGETVAVPVKDLGTYLLELGIQA